MSLIRQVWLLLLGTVVFAFVGSAVVTVSSVRDTLQTQLQLKNSDSATSLALVLSQQKGDAAMMDILMSAQFDTGFFREVRLTDANGKTVFVRESTLAPAHAPAWFVAATPITSTPGVAQVSDGWRALGSLRVVSHTAFAHDDLWRGSLQSAATLGVVGLLAGLVAAAVVARIRRPLDQTVQQAQSLVNGQFITVAEPSIPELQRLTRAMNTMVRRLKTIFDAQADQVEALRQQATCDPLTGLANRKHFLGQLTATLQREDGAVESGLVLMRVLDLAGLNRRHGHATTDRLVHAVAQALQEYAAHVPGSHLGRLNGSDFALCLPAGGVALETAQAVTEALRVLVPAFGPNIGIVAGAVEMQRDRELAQVMAAVDTALAQAESRGAFAVELGHGAPGADSVSGEGAWREHITAALRQGRVRLVAFPLIDATGALVHLECPLRLQLDAHGPFEAASRWLPMALRSRLTAAIDERAVAMALTAIARDGLPRCVNVSAASLGDGAFVSRVRSLVLASPRVASSLWIEVPEAAASEQFEWVQELARQLRPGGVKVGLEHAGDRLARIEKLFEAGLDYVKLDGSVVQGVAQDPDRASFVRGITSMMHGLSLQVYAEGVMNAADAQMLWTLGVDGVTGRWASDRRADLVT